MGGVDLDVDRLKKAWRLTDEEEDEVLFPGGLWRAGGAVHSLCLVGRLLSNRPYRFEALCTSMKGMFLSVKGVEITQLEEGRLLFRFNHIIDKQRVLEGCPWSFEKSILILSAIGEFDSPMSVALDHCDFFRYGGGCGGLPLGSHPAVPGGLNVTKPLKRALKLRSLTGEELLVRFTYERLPNICYLCGCLGHIDRYCEVRFDKGFCETDDMKPYGPWLRAPIPTRKQIPTQLQGKGFSNAGATHRQPPARTGAAIFGAFSHAQVPHGGRTAPSAEEEGSKSVQRGKGVDWLACEGGSPRPVLEDDGERRDVVMPTVDLESSAQEGSRGLEDVSAVNEFSGPITWGSVLKVRWRRQRLLNQMGFVN
ncbi:UNVERIFIED_CONTAM: hypothetical protein Slati_2191600 [Sesamum latifolium]|uniref:CCHC-type domain-containing protein n=1 Tax=Sesamum latifolium TaxID=2727402 RepID=A0AAW2WUQ5_9LAMI